VQIEVETAPNVPSVMASGAPPPSQNFPPATLFTFGTGGSSKSHGLAYDSRSVPRSDDAGNAHQGIKSIFSEQAGGVHANSRALSSTRITFALQFLDLNSTRLLTEFKNDLSRDIQAMTYQAVIDVAIKPGSQLLQVKISCEWKTPIHAYSIRRTIKDSIAGRFHVDTVRVFQMDSSSIISHSDHNPSRWLQHSQPKGAAYTVPIENFVNALGKEVQAQEAMFLKCQTLAQFRDDARSKQVLLCNLHDALRWRFRQVLQNQSAFRFRNPSQSLEVSPVAGQASTSGHAPVAPTPDAPPCPAVALTESSSSVTGDLSPPAPSPNARCRSLTFSDESVAQTLSVGDRPACDTGVGPAGMFHTM
jgi:hypothetical protein